MTQENIYLSQGSATTWSSNSCTAQEFYVILITSKPELLQIILSYVYQECTPSDKNKMKIESLNYVEFPSNANL